jgi:hypothetical protein
MLISLHVIVLFARVVALNHACHALSYALFRVPSACCFTLCRVSLRIFRTLSRVLLNCFHL